MRITSLLTLTAGLAVAGGSAYLARDLLEAKYAKGEVKVCTNELVRVVVATQDIPFGKVMACLSRSARRLHPDFDPSADQRYRTASHQDGNRQG
jgi:Flp pilus assembly protein CpaB